MSETGRLKAKVINLITNETIPSKLELLSTLLVDFSNGLIGDEDLLWYLSLYKRGRISKIEGIKI